MKYKVKHEARYDFTGQGYSSVVPNLHKYPATMLPQIGTQIMRDFDVRGGRMLDPYCGSGSSFISGLSCDIDTMHGYDLNPLAVLITKVRLTRLCAKEMEKERAKLREKIFQYLKTETPSETLEMPTINNRSYWFSDRVSAHLNVIRFFVQEIKNPVLRDFFRLAFSETVRNCSLTRKHEFKLYRMKEEEVLIFNPDVVGVYFSKLQRMSDIYLHAYLPRLKERLTLQLTCGSLERPKENFYDIVLTSPPYGDSRTTVAYGQFSTFSNEWMGIKDARKIDRLSMGGKKSNGLYNKGLMREVILKVSEESSKRALEISSFYKDLESSIKKVALSTKRGGKAAYVVGNRTVSGKCLPTDQFIAEQFEDHGFQHLTTYERKLSNKSMPNKNSPTNQRGKVSQTMNHEYIVVMEKQ